MGWLPAIDGYEVSLIDGVIACRKDSTVLRSVPSS
jgi:hypothetical protein